MSRREQARLTEELGRLQVQGSGDWYGQFMEANALFEDRDSRVTRLEGQLDRLQMEYREERTMRKMLEQQYTSLKKKVRCQALGSFPYMGVLRSDIPSASLGSVARQLHPTKRGRHKEGGSIVAPRDGEEDGGAEGREESRP